MPVRRLPRHPVHVAVGGHVVSTESGAKGVVKKIKKAKTGIFLEVLLVPTGGLVVMRSTKVKEIHLTPEEVKSVPATYDKKTELQLWLDGSIKVKLTGSIDSDADFVSIHNEFICAAGRNRRQIVSTSEKSAKCNLGCGCVFDFTKFDEGMHYAKAHTGTFESTKSSCPKTRNHMQGIRKLVGLPDQSSTDDLQIVKRLSERSRGDTRYWTYTGENNIVSDEPELCKKRKLSSVERYDPSPFMMQMYRPPKAEPKRRVSSASPKNQSHKRKRGRPAASSAKKKTETKISIATTRTESQLSASGHLRRFSALKLLHDDLAPQLSGVRSFPRDRQLMPVFQLENVHNKMIDNRSHEAFEQFVVSWMFQDIVSRFTLRDSAPGEPAPATLLRHETEKISEPHEISELLFPSEVVVPRRASYEWWRVHRIRVLELGGGIGAVSTMIQQMLSSLDPEGQHIVFEPNAQLANGALQRNKDRFRSNFTIINGVLSDKSDVKLRSGSISADHPRAWMWGTIQDDSSQITSTVPGYTLHQVEQILGGKANVLIADCEGGLPPIIDAYPEILDDLFCVYYERDPGDYIKFETLLIQKGFYLVLKTKMHRVWVREEAEYIVPSLLGSSIAARDKGEIDEDAIAIAQDRALALHTAERAQLENKVIELQKILADVDALCTRIDVTEFRIAQSIRDGPLKLAQTLLSSNQAAAARLRRNPLSLSNSSTFDRLLVKGTRVLCPFFLEENGSDSSNDEPSATLSDMLYAGIVAEAPASAEEEHDGYYILFDDGDERYNVPRSELHPIFMRGTFEFASAFTDDQDKQCTFHRTSNHEDDDATAEKRIRREVVTKTKFARHRKSCYEKYLQDFIRNQDSESALRALQDLEVSLDFIENDGSILAERIYSLQKSDNPAIAALAKLLTRKWRAAISAARKQRDE